MIFAIGTQRRISRQEHKVVAVSEVVAAFQPVFDELVQAVQVYIGEELTVEVADRQTLVFRRMEQGLPGIALEDIMLCAIMKGTCLRRLLPRNWR